MITVKEIGKLNFYGWTKDGMKENPKGVPIEDIFVLRSAVLAALQNNKISECYFIPEKKGTSVTICTNCGKEKMLHTIGEGIKVSKVIYQSEPTVSGISAEEVINTIYKRHKIDLKNPQFDITKVNEMIYDALRIVNERKDSEEMPDIEKLIEKFLPNQFYLASSKPEVVELLKSAFQQGATVIFNVLQDKRPNR